MKRLLLPASAALLCIALLLSPIVAALPDDTTAQQPLWASALSACVFLSAVLCFLAGRVGDSGKMPLLAYAGLLCWMCVSILARLLAQHDLAYFGPMLHGVATWAVFGTAFTVCIHLTRHSRMYFYALVGAVLTASAWSGSLSLSEYLQHVKIGEFTWRVFGTSTPDFLAAYFVLLIPLTLSMLLRLPSGKEMKSPLLGIALPGLAGLILLTQAMTLLATGSRFALVSVTVGIAAFLVALCVAVRRGMPLERTARLRLVVLATVVLVPALVVARPVLARLSNLHDNSGAFRLWTWRGAIRMAAANLVTGAGVGTWQDTYPRYALVGFTRLAHNSYLQMADECGLPGGLLLLTVLGLTVWAGARRLVFHEPDMKTPVSEAASTNRPVSRRRKPPSTGQLDISTASRPFDFQPETTILTEPLLLCGLLGAVAGGIVQNLIDSDWYVFFFGLTFWAIAGLLVGLVVQETTETKAPSRPILRLLRVGGSIVLCAYFVAQTMAAFYSAQGRTAQNTQEAQTSFALAQVWDGLNARHHTDMASRVYNPAGNLTAAEGEIHRAIRLQPSGGNFLRLGRVLTAQQQTGEALAAYQAGLRADPNSVDLLLEAARLSPNGKIYYQRMADLETGPVGTVRAIGEIVEVKFAYADAALGLYARAARLLESYAVEGGSTNMERTAAMGGQSNPAQDRELRALYVQVMDGLNRMTPSAEQPQLAQRRQKTLDLFDKLLASPSDGVH